MGRRKDRSVPSAEDVALPDDFRARAAALFGQDYAKFESALTEPSPTSIRLNARKTFTIAEEQVPWCVLGRYLRERPSFTHDPLFHAGAYYVQEASSMLLEQALRACELIGRDILALDLCAAPGGKSTHLLSLLGEGSLLVANEVVPARRNILAENLWKSGAGNVLVSGSDPTDLQRLPGFFDLVVVDAPCSGEGMFRKDPFARKQWSPKLVEQCALMQRGIVAHAWEALAPGGALIYSTCTWETSENEAQLEPLLADGGECIPIPLDESWGVMRTEQNGMIGQRCYPHLVKGEGFFIAVIRKAGVSHVRVKANDAGTKSHYIPWIDPATSVLEHQGILHASPTSWKNEVDILMAALRMHAPGIPVAEKKGDAWTPHAASALSTLLDRNAFPAIELDEAQALAYLRGEALPAQDAKGSALACYRGFGLGWLQGAGRRWNNRWPTPWRIRTQRPGAANVSWSVVR